LRGKELAFNDVVPVHAGFLGEKTDSVAQAKTWQVVFLTPLKKKFGR